LTHLAVGTSLASIIFTSVNAVREHHRRGAVRWPIFVWMAVGILLGAGVGALTAEAISGPHLQKIIGVFALVIALQMTLELKPKASRQVPGKLGLTLAGGVPMQQAVATSSACGLPIALASALSFMILGWHDPLLPEHSLGFVYLPALLGIALTSMVAARFGARLAHRLSPRLLKRLFAGLLFCVGLNFLL